MATCPSCNKSIPWDVAECPECKASFWTPGGLSPLPESEEEKRQLLNKAAQVGADLRTSAAEFNVRSTAALDFERNHYIPKRSTLVFLALALAFFLSIVNVPMPDGFPVYRAYLLHTSINNWLPAIAAYLLLRMTRLHSLLRSRVAINRMITVVGLLLIVNFLIHLLGKL